MPKPSAMDVGYGKMASEHLSAFRKRWTSRALTPVLEIGPEHEVCPGADTLDLKPGATWQGDITQRTVIPSSSYRTVIATGVLEHTVDPFAAVREITRILRWADGLLLVSAPWNFRIHGPTPDLWRFNQNTWRLLLKDYTILDMDVLDTPCRPLSPIHICVAARPGHPVPVSDLQFNPIDR